MTSWIHLADFAATLDARTRPELPWAHPPGQTRSVLDLAPPARRAIEEVVDTVVALQRAEWLEDGVYLGPRAFADASADRLACARRLGLAVPPAVVTSCAGGRQACLGTDERPILHLSSLFLKAAPADERRFLLGRLMGPIAARHVTLASLYALLVDHDGLRRMARRNLGPTLEIALAPLSLAARVALARWHRAAEITADRAGLLCAGDVRAAGRALLRLSLGVTPDVDPDAYLDGLSAADDGSPGRFAELLSSRPWTHTRMRALHLFARSVPWYTARGQTPPPDALSPDDLAQRTRALLEVGRWSG